MRTLKFAALVTAVLAVGFGLYFHFLPKGGPPDAGPYLKAVFPGAASYEKVEDGPYPYYRALGPTGPEGVVFVTTDLAPGVKGYSGQVPVAVGLMPDGRVAGIRVLKNNETPSYSKRVESPGFSGQFAGKPVTDPLELDRDIDGVTRATVTARAVTDGVRQASRRAASDIFGLAVPTDEPGLSRAFKDPALYVLLLLFAASLLLYLAGRSGADVTPHRLALLAAALVFLGVIKASPLSLVNLFSLVALRLPGPASLSWYLLTVGSVIAALFWGRLYCGWLCPFGALQEFLSWLPVRKLAVDPALDSKARGLKYVVLWLVTVAAFASGLLEVANFEPYGTLFSLQGGALAWGLVGVTLGAGIVVPRFWCRYLCPVGAALGLVSNASLFTGRRFEGCDDCGACAGGCTMGNRAHGEAGSLKSECILCDRCVSACPKRRGASDDGR